MAFVYLKSQHASQLNGLATYKLGYHSQCIESCRAKYDGNEYPKIRDGYIAIGASVSIMISILYVVLELLHYSFEKIFLSKYHKM